MKSVVVAQINCVNDIVNIDTEVIGSDSRRTEITKAIEEKRCIVAINEKQSIVGFLIYHTHFFSCSFISLLIVSPKERRKGYASALMKYFQTISPTNKIFSSTNQSNSSMQKVFECNGFIRSGFVDHLDEGDLEVIYYKGK